MFICRYADDFVILIKGTREQAAAVKDDVGRFLECALKLRLSPDKTLITNVHNGFDFLGLIFVEFPAAGHSVPLTTSFGGRYSAVVNASLMRLVPELSMCKIISLITMMLTAKTAAMQGKSISAFGWTRVRRLSLNVLAFIVSGIFLHFRS